MEEKKYPIGGFAPGNYHNRCSTCERSFFGDKQAVQCEPCALEAKARFDALSPEEQEALIKKNASIANYMLSAALTPERDLIYRIVEQWGNAIEMPNMEQWLKDYAASRPTGAVWVKASEFKTSEPVYRPYRRKRNNDNEEPYDYGEIYVTEDNGDIFFDVNNERSFEPQTYERWKDYEILDESGTAATSINQDAHEKEVMMRAFDKVRRIFEGRKWIMEGRGSYPYNDDKYKEEVRYMYDEFDKVFKDTWGNIESKSFEYRKAIISEYLNESPAAAREEDAVALLNWLNNEGWKQHNDGTWYNLISQQYDYTSQKVAELFKQQKEK